MDNSNPLKCLEYHLESSIENIRQMEIMIADFQPQGQNALNQKLWVSMKLVCLCV